MGILQAVRQRLEGRATLRNPVADWLSDALGGGLSDSGEPVSRDKALMLSTVFHAVTLISNDVSKTPLVTYRNVGKGKTRATDHPSYFLLNERPNRWQTKPDFWRDIMADALLGHGGYCYINRDRNTGMPIELIRLLGSRVCTEPADTWRTFGRRVKYRLDDGTFLEFAPEDVLQVRGLSWDGLDGYEFASVAKQSVGYGLALQKHGNKFFANNAVPGLVVSGENITKPETVANIRKNIDDTVGTLDNHYRTIVLTHNAKAEQMMIDPRNAQLIEQRMWSVADIANWFSLQAHKLNADITTSYASIPLNYQTND